MPSPKMTALALTAAIASGLQLSWNPTLLVCQEDDGAGWYLSLKGGVRSFDTLLHCNGVREHYCSTHDAWYKCA